MPAAVCLGEALVDFVADVAGVTLAECPGFRKAPGGAPANVAVGLARLGVGAAFVGRVGEDPFGHFLADTFEAAGVDTRFVSFDGEARTGLAFVSLKADGDREFAFFRNPSADMLLRPEHIPNAALSGCRVYHFGSITLVQDPSRRATLDALERARKGGALISFDPNLRPLLWPSLEQARRQILAGLPRADIVKLSDEEAEFLYGPGTMFEHAESVLAAGPRLVALTRGRAGCHLATRNARITLAGFPVEVIDTTGAGDGFVAGLLRCLLDRQNDLDLSNEELREIGLFANAVGGLTCRRKGAIPALPTRAEVMSFLAAHP